MYSLKFILVVVFSWFSHHVFSQISGIVTDAKNESVIGASVMLKNTDKGTFTDIDGKFMLNESSGILVITYIGYKTKEVPATPGILMNIVLEEEATVLESLVVVGYGTQKKKDLTSAITVVDEKAIKDRPMTSAAEALQGKAAGVQVVQPSGKPGENISVRVRGATSVLAGNEPLYVVDGLPTTDIRGLNPSDIETMSVLKDASSASIYGARAANGVVLITTKRGKANQSNVSFSTYAGVSRLRQGIDVLSTKGYRDLMNEISPGSIDPTRTNSTDWSEEVFGTGTIQNYQLSVAGGSEKSRYLLSGGYLNNTGIVAPAKYSRYSLRMNLDNEVRSWVNIGANMNVLFANTKNTQDNASSGRGGVIMSALNTPPFLRIYNPNNPQQYDPNPFQPSWENPVAYMNGPDQNQTDNRLLGNVYAEIKLAEGLKFKSTFGADLNTFSRDYYLDPVKTNFGRNQNGVGNATKSTTNSWLIENTLGYSKSGNHAYSFLLGQSAQKLQWNQSYIQGNDFPDDVSVKTLNAANNISASTNREAWSLTSFFGRATYSYVSKYIFSASLRRDGSSKLADHWGTMPAVSAAWRVSAEPFFPKTDVIDDVKIRMGWGKNGNQEGIANYARYGLINYFRTPLTSPLSGPASAQVTYGNPGLKWETTTQSNIGLDVLMFNGRLTFIADVYYKKTNDVLLNVQLSNSLPITSIQTNAGTIENKGLDLSVSTVNLNKKLRWNSDFNISFNKNNVVELNYTDVYYFGRIYSNNQDVSILKAGAPLGSFFGYIAEGVNPETGDMIYKDVNNNGILDPNDRTIIGNAQPDFTFGFTNDFYYKNFDLNIFIQGSVGNDIYNATRIDLEGMFDSKNQSVAVLDRWTPDNKITNIPRAVRGGSVYNVWNSTRFVEDGSYVRLKAITLGYTLPQKLLKSIRLSKARFYLTGQNLITLTKYSGLDPEVNAFGLSATELGIDYGTYPHARTAILGLNLDF